MDPNSSEHLLVSDLRFPRQLLLWAFRQTRHGGGQAIIKQLIADALQRVGLSQAHRHLDILVDCFAADGGRRLHLLPPDHSWVSCDEMLLLDALGTLQSGCDYELTHFWQLWLSPSGVRLASAHAAAIAAQFRNAGLLLGAPDEYVAPIPSRPLSVLLH
jgi:hypothetical protein